MTELDRPAYSGAWSASQRAGYRRGSQGAGPCPAGLVSVGYTTAPSLTIRHAGEDAIEAIDILLRNLIGIRTGLAREIQAETPRMPGVWSRSSCARWRLAAGHGGGRA